jgi:hypothetical protein
VTAVSTSAWRNGSGNDNEATWDTEDDGNGGRGVGDLE